jgi:hypothetical protein
MLSSHLKHCRSHREEAGVKAMVEYREGMRVMGVAQGQGGEDDANEGAGDKEGSELLVVGIGKRKVAELGEDGEDEVEVKRTRFTTSGLLDFEGPVSGECRKSRCSLNVCFSFTV